MDSKQRKSFSLVFFLLVSFLHLLGFLINNEPLRVYTKPLLLISLFIYYWASVIVKNKLYIVALFFSFLGDVLLISDLELNFMMGLGAFLVSHLFYIFLIAKQLKPHVFKNKILSSLPFIGVFCGLIVLLKSSLAEMLIPVVVYGLTISIFGTVSLLNYRVEQSKPAISLLIGAVLFIISDSILAINKFYDSNDLFPISIMVTYIGAQYFICQFVIKSEKVKLDQT